MLTVFQFFLPVILALIFVAVLAFPWRYTCLYHNHSSLNKSAPKDQVLGERLGSYSFAGEWFLDCALTHLRTQADKPEHANDKELAAIIAQLESALAEAYINLWVGDHGAIDMIVETASDELVKYNQAQLKKQLSAGITAISQ